MSERASSLLRLYFDIPRDIVEAANVNWCGTAQATVWIWRVSPVWWG